MTLTHEHAVEVLIALAILAHAWSPRIVAPAPVLSVIGWIINLLTILALASLWVRC